MLTYTMSADGNSAVIGPCHGGTVRLSIIRLCRELGVEIPPETLEEDTDIETLCTLSTDLLIRRAEWRKAKHREEILRQVLAATKPAPRSVQAPAAEVAELRKRAAQIRQAAQYADDHGAYTAEMAAAAHLEQEAKRLASL